MSIVATIAFWYAAIVVGLAVLCLLLACVAWVIKDLGKCE